MSLGIAFKGPEGVVLAADSRVTLTAQMPAQPGMPVTVLPATFDNATKLLKAKGQDYVGAVTFGAGAIIGSGGPRTAHSFMPEFEAEIAAEGRLSVEKFARTLGAFFLRQWTTAGMAVPAPPGGDMVFFVGGYDQDAPYGDLFQVTVPNIPTPSRMIPVNEFGAAWGGQRAITDRILDGFDPEAPGIAKQFFNSQQDAGDLQKEFKRRFGIRIPWQFLPLQDCVDLSIFLIRTTITLQKWMVDLRGVGGAVDVATITRTGGFRPVQVKQIIGEKIL
jgi:hypothetical protein